MFKIVVDIDLVVEVLLIFTAICAVVIMNSMVVFN